MSIQWQLPVEFFGLLAGNVAGDHPCSICEI
jgi:hypothetical protein